MSWAKYATEALARGETVQIKPRGHSMKGKVNDGDLVTVEPCDPNTLTVGDIVLVEIQGRRYSHVVLHLVKAIEQGTFLIGSHQGRIDGWVGPHSIYGKATKVEAS